VIGDIAILHEVVRHLRQDATQVFAVLGVKHPLEYGGRIILG